jgi:hypothetical protein
MAARAQGERTARNGLYVEVGGPGTFYSLNYERFVHDDVSLRLGGSYVRFTGTSTDATWFAVGESSLTLIPLTASYLGLRSGSHALELGGGAVIASIGGDGTTDFDVFGSASGVVGTGILGYRLAPLGGGFNFRVAYTPFFADGRVFEWFGVALGGLF